MLRTIFATALILMLAGVGATTARADPVGSLFINVTSDDAHRGEMAFHFAEAMVERGHGVTIWLNDKGVLWASKHTDKFSQQQKALTELMAKGATVIACPSCLKHLGLKESDLLEGIKIGNPELTSDLLFREGTRTLSW